VFAVVSGDRLTLDAFLAMPRVAALHLSPDGSRLVATVQTVAPDGKRFAGALWDVDPAGRRPARRLTHSAKGETMQGFLPDGSILFTSPRPDVASPEGEAPDAPFLYLLPAAGGEPVRVCAPEGGVGQVLTGRDAWTVVAGVPLHPGAASLEEDAERDKRRRDAGVEALLIEHYPMNWWDHILGPRHDHLLALDLAAATAPTPRDLTPQVPWPGWLEETSLSLSPDGRWLLVGARMRPGGEVHIDLLRIDVATGAQRVLRQAAVDHDSLAVSPDGRLVACAESDWGQPDRPHTQRLLLVDVETGEARELLPGWEGNAVEITWAPDGSALFVTADEGGHTPIVRLGLDGSRTRLTASGAYSQVRPSPDGRTLYALRSHPDAPPAPVALDAQSAHQEPRPLLGPAAPPSFASHLDELTASAPDGTPIHAWLVLPDSASAATPAPLALLVHGGPFSSWSGWQWRWCAQVFAAHGYAVLMPDPRLSTGYGHAHLASAWNDWGDIPLGDLMACVDAAVARPDVDAERLAALGASYGGYMANWIAGHSDRFRCVVTHASVWALDQMHGTTDFGPFLEHQFGSPYTEFETWMAQSPHRSVARIRTPMLISHGDRDRRVPSAEAVRLWTDLHAHGVPAKLLWFPDENHWVLKPQNARVWYQAVLAFLDEHVRGEPWRRPELL